MEKPRRVDHEAKLTQIAGERRGTFETGLVQQIGGRRGASTELHHVLEPIRGPDCCDQCSSYTAAGAENDRDPGLRKR